MAAEISIWGFVRSGRGNDLITHLPNISPTCQWRSPLTMWLAIGGVIFVSPLSAIAQIQPIPDDTLGSERSFVSPDQAINNLPSNKIDGGAQRGGNLFHSFLEFDIDAGRGAYFTNPAGVANIITRVTGGNQSEILGTLGVLGNANLFLINPSGILTKQNAQLDLGGSFVASTANSVVFDNGFAFGATDPQAPPLLTVNVPMGLQYGGSPGAIQLQGASLKVTDGQTLTLTGGTVNVEGGELLAPGGRVELAGVAAGEVGLTQQGQEWRLSVPEGLARADVAIRNDAIINVRSAGGGSIIITAQNLTVTGEKTRVRAGIAEGVGTVDAQAGDIDIKITETININESGVFNTVQEGGIGNAGDITITTGSLSLTNGAEVNTSTAGQGNAGNINITARDAVSIDGLGSDESASGTFSVVNPGAIGKGGDINITTGVFSINNGGFINSSTVGQGDAGNINIMARDAVSLDDVSSDGFPPTGIYSQVAPGAIGQGGDISISTGKLFLTNGGLISVSTTGQGNAGNINITARDAVSFDGTGSDGSPSAAYSQVNPGAIGQGGDISITTGTLSLTNGGLIGVSTTGQGDAGNINITARDAVSFDGVSSDGFLSGIYSNVAPGAVGQGGDISIATGTLSLTNGASVDASMFGQGDAGNINITARDAVSFDGVGSNGFTSGAFSTVELGAIGQGGRITVNTELFSITNRAELSVSSKGQGDSGNIEVDARQLRLDNQGSIQAQTASGQGGNIKLQVSDLLLLRRGSTISTTAGTAQSGGIALQNYIKTYNKKRVPNNTYARPLQ